MATRRQDFQIFRGEAKTIVLTVKTPDGQLIDLSTSTFIYRVRDTEQSTTNRLEKTTEVLVDGPGVLRIPFVHNDTQLPMPSGTLWHELRVVDQLDEEIVVMTGRFTLDESVTNNP